jgi:hypothetical protein
VAVKFALLLMLFVLAVSAAGAFTPYVMFETQACFDECRQPSILKIQLGLFFSGFFSDVRNNVFINDGLARELELCFRPEIFEIQFNSEIVFPTHVKSMCAHVQTHAKATAGLVASSLACLVLAAVYLSVALRLPGTNPEGSFVFAVCEIFSSQPKVPEVKPGECFFKALSRALNISKWFTLLAALASFGASVVWATRDAFDFNKPSLDGLDLTLNLTLEESKATILDDLGPGWPLEVATFVLSVVCLARVHLLHKTCKNVLATHVPKPAGSTNDALGSTRRFEPALVVNGVNGRNPPAQMTMGTQVAFGSSTTRVAPAPLVSDYNGMRALPTAMGMQHMPHAASVVPQMTMPSQVPPYTTNTAHVASPMYVAPGGTSYAASSTKRSGVHSGLRRATVELPTERTGPGGRRGLGTDRTVEFRDSPRMPAAASHGRWASD